MGESVSGCLLFEAALRIFTCCLTYVGGLRGGCRGLLCRRPSGRVCKTAGADELCTPAVGGLALVND
jgi:hypothetical protein